MKYSILGFNQAKVIKTNLDLSDLVLLQYIMQASGSPMKHVIVDDISYVWLNHKKIHEDLPILNIKERMLQRRLHNLIEGGWLLSYVQRDKVNTRAFYAITTQTEELMYDRGETASSEAHVSQYMQEGVSQCTSSGVSQCASDILVLDNKLNNKNISKDISEPNGSELSEQYKQNNESSATVFFGSAKPKKLSLYDKCVLKINEYTDDAELREALVKYLVVRLAMKDKPIYGVNQWVGMLNKLSVMDNQLAVVQKSLAHGWAMFYDGKSAYHRGVDRSVFSETADIKSKKGDKDEKLYGRF